jgi:hypothetical protein
LMRCGFVHSRTVRGAGGRGKRRQTDGKAPFYATGVRQPSPGSRVFERTLGRPSNGTLLPRRGYTTSGSCATLSGWSSIRTVVIPRCAR